MGQCLTNASLDGGWVPRKNLGGLWAWDSAVGDRNPMVGGEAVQALTGAWAECLGLCD